MFFTVQILRSIKRSLFRCILTFGIAFLLFVFLGFYLGNIENNQKTLMGLPESMPVEFQVMSLDGTRQIGLEISTDKMDALLASDIRNPVYTAQAGGNYEPVNRVENVKACDTVIVGANDFSAFPSIDSDAVSWVAGTDQSFLSGNAPSCVISDSYASLHDIALGDTIEFPLYTYRYNQDGASFYFMPAGEVQLAVTGIFTYEKKRDTSGGQDMIVPVDWLRQTVLEQGTVFFYDSFRALVNNPLQLNSFKSSMENIRFAEIRSDANSMRSGDALVVQDKVFIETAAKLRQNADTLKRFQIPVFIIVILLMVLTIFLLLRSRRREIAIASSVGRSKILCALELFTENMVLVLLAVVLAIPVLLFVTGIGLYGVLSVGFIFLACSFAGIWIALLLLMRFDTLSLLTKAD